MASVKPFAALRPRPELAAQICELPYDVMSEDEARRLADANPLSFLHVSRPEVGLPRGTDTHAPAVYDQARRAFAALRSRGALVPEPRPGFYLYRQIMGGHSQTGVVGAASCAEYLEGTVRKHELTRPDKEDDRVRHIETLDAQTGPAFLFHRAVPALAQFIAGRVAGAPDVDFTAPDGVQHTTWTVADGRGVATLEAAFADIPLLYIADGHHRSAAAGRVFQTRRGAGGSAGFLSVIFPHDALQILPYHRVLKDLNGLTAAQILERLGKTVAVSEGGGARPAGRHELGLYLEGRWRTLRFHPALAAAGEPVDQLDVALLQRHVLGPVFGIEDPRTSKRIGFVGGIRGPGELERLVQQGEAACAFALYPTGIEELMAIADGGGIMPPKSTWFEPKLRDALFSLPI
jgi:uncharacterized protein (DUF1015 family)